MCSIIPAVKFFVTTTCQKGKPMPQPIMPTSREIISGKVSKNPELSKLAAAKIAELFAAEQRSRVVKKAG